MVTLEEFVESLIRLGTRERPLPRRRRDRQMLFKSILLTLDSGRSYTEAEINEGLRGWNAEVAPAIQTDHVTLRRMLVDSGHLERTVDGRAYRVGFPTDALAFELEVDDLEPRQVIAAYLANRPPPRTSAP